MAVECRGGKMDLLFVGVIVVGIVALLFAVYLSFVVVKAEGGTPRMQEIAGFIHNGAMAFLKSEYKYLSIFAALVTVTLVFAINIETAMAFVLGAMLSMLAGFFGMKIATQANVKTAQAARTSQKKALTIAFSGGAVMGMSVVGLGIVGLGILLMVFSGDVLNMTGFGLGASSIALFARVGGGIYTKAADVGADLVGKMEAGIPEDDPRNPAVIADNVGDNVGDVAGMGADLFESYVGSIISAITLGSIVFGRNGALFPLVLSAIGIVSSIIGIIIVRASHNPNAQRVLNIGTYVAGILC
jgi:K(+)-stimulated pyrophosphate-energized sodium pump